MLNPGPKAHALLGPFTFLLTIFPFFATLEPLSASVF